MGKANIILNRKGVSEVLKSQEMHAIVYERAKSIADASGKGYKADVHTGRRRARASVITDSVQAIRDNAKRNTILRNAKGK